MICQMKQEFNPVLNISLSIFPKPNSRPLKRGRVVFRVAERTLLMAVGMEGRITSFAEENLIEALALVRKEKIYQMKQVFNPWSSTFACILHYGKGEEGH